MRRNGLILALGIVGVGVMSLASVRAEPRSAREAKDGGISFHLASTTPIKGYDKVSTDGDGGALYVAPQPVWTGKEVVSERTTDARNGSVMELTLSAAAAERLAAQRKQQGGDRVAIYVDGKLASSGSLNVETSGGRTTITELNSVNTERVVRLLKGERPAPVPVPTASALVTIAPAGQSDGAYLVDVFVQGVANLRSYQVGLVTSGGESGTLVGERVKIARTRPDFVFTELNAVFVDDYVGGPLGAVLIDGVVDKPAPAYLGTYAFRPSPDASGTFEVTVDTGGKTLFADGNSQMIEFRTGPAALINIGSGPTRQVIDK